MSLKMDIKEFAKSLNGREHGYPLFSKEEIKTAKENGFVIVYGLSDDLMEFRGAIRDEGVCCFNGGKVYFNKNEVCRDSEKEVDYPNCITAIWDRDKDENGRLITWTYETDILHETFMIYEEGEPYPYCRGIVFSIDDLKQNNAICGIRRSYKMSDALELYKLCCTDDNEYSDCFVDKLGWISDTKFCVWVSYLYLKEFLEQLTKIFGNGIFADGGFDANMQEDCVCIDLCEAVGSCIDVETVFTRRFWRISRS